MVWLVKLEVSKNKFHFCAFLSCKIQISMASKAKKILEDSLNSIPSPSVKIQIMGRKFGLKCKGKTLLVMSTNFFVQNVCWQLPGMFGQNDKNKNSKCSRLLEGDGIESRLPFRIFSTLKISCNISLGLTPKLKASNLNLKKYPLKKHNYLKSCAKHW